MDWRWWSCSRSSCPTRRLSPCPSSRPFCCTWSAACRVGASFTHPCRTASKDAVATLILIFALTIVSDLVVTIAAGMLVTIVLFMKMVSEKTEKKGWC